MNDIFSKVLILSPHFDDETIGCGGLIHKISSDSLGKVMIVQYTNRSNKVRRHEYSKAISNIDPNNVVTTEYFGYQDGELDQCSKRDYVTELDRILVDYRPTTVLFPLPSHNQDHNLVHEIGLAAVRPKIGVEFIRMRACYEYIPNMYYRGTFGNPSLFVELSNSDITAKKQALDCYESQLIRDPADPIDVSSIIELSVVRGKSIARRYAEAYYPIQVII